MLGRTQTRRVAAALIATALTTSAAAQDTKSIDRRVATLEAQVRAVQRKVFPGTDGRTLAPEITAATPSPAPAAAVADPGSAALSARVDAIEARLRELTGQVEQLQFQNRNADAAETKARADIDARLSALEHPGGQATPASAPAPLPVPPPPVAPAAAAPPAPATTGVATPDAQFNAAYALYEKGDFTAAATALQAFADAHPRSPKVSNARYWYGRALMGEGQPAGAAKAFLDNYRAQPKGERAPNSLLWLGKALIALKQPKAACSPLDQLGREYPSKVTGLLKTELDKARAEARCDAHG